MILGLTNIVKISVILSLSLSKNEQEIYEKQ